MKKSLFASLLAISCLHMSIVPEASAGLKREGEPDGASGTDTEKPAESKTRKITMDDGRSLEFTEKQKIQKAYGTEEGNVFARIDFENGKSVKVLVFAGNLTELASYTPPDGSDNESAEVKASLEQAKFAKMTLNAIGHGLVQKLGDAAAGAETIDDALEAILEVANRINKGEWNKAREGGTAKGAGDLVTAMTEYMQKTVNPELTKDAVRDMLGELSPAEKNGLRQLDEVKVIIDRLKAARTPTKREQEGKAKAAALLEGLKKGELPKREPEGEGEPAGETSAA